MNVVEQQLGVLVSFVVFLSVLLGFFKCVDKYEEYKTRKALKDREAYAAQTKAAADYESGVSF